MVSRIAPVALLSLLACGQEEPQPQTTPEPAPVAVDYESFVCGQGC